MPFGKKKDRPIYVVNVHYYGDVELANLAPWGDFDPTDLDIRAWVEVPEAQELVPGRNALVGLIPMLAPTHLFFNANAATGALYPAVQLLKDTSADLLKGEEAARSYSVEGVPITVGGAPMFGFEETVEARIPSVIPESEGESSRIHEFALMQRGDDLWSRSRAPELGGQAYFANSGLMLLIQHVANNADYEETTVPIAAGLGAFVGQFEAYEKEASEDIGEELTEAHWADLGEGILKMQWDVIGLVAYSDDPAEYLAELLATR
jgi:hypothetical protein